MADENKTYEQGRQDALKMYGTYCTGQGDCSTCSVGVLKGDAVTCQEFLRQFPNKAVTIIADSLKDGESYIDAFYQQNPASTSTRDAIYNNVCCMDIFNMDGNICPKGEGNAPDCEKCWNMKLGEVNNE